MEGNSNLNPLSKSALGIARWPSRITDPNSPKINLIMNEGAGMNAGLLSALPIALASSMLRTGSGEEKSVSGDPRVC